MTPGRYKTPSGPYDDTLTCIDSILLEVSGEKCSKNGAQPVRCLGSDIDNLGVLGFVLPYFRSGNE